MCGRFTLTVDQEALAAALAVEGLVHPHPRWNIAPSQETPALVHTEEGIRGARLRWGLVPFWAGDPAIGNRLINARSETAHQKPSFRNAFRRGRCLIPADGFYEWQKQNGAKVPWWIHPEVPEGEADPSSRILTFAGLSERWEGEEGEVLRTFTILTADASESIRALHHRMPVVIPRALRARWLEPGAEVDELREFLAAGPDRPWAAREVSTRVNSPANDDPSLLEPPGPPGSDLPLFERTTK